MRDWQINAIYVEMELIRKLVEEMKDSNQVALQRMDERLGKIKAIAKRED